MEFKLITKVAAGFAACALAVSLSACGGASGADEIHNSKEPVSVSQAFGAKGLWFVTDEGEAPGKDQQIEAILSFDGDGNVTHYDVADLDFGDLKDLSDEEIFNRLNEWDRKGFDEWVKNRLHELDVQIEDNEAWDPANPVQAENKSARIAGLKETRGQIEALEYQEPKAVPFKLSIETDDSGNNTAEETLSYTIQVPVYYEFDSPYDENILWADEEQVYTFTSIGTDSPMVYEKYYNGYYEAGLWTQVGEDFSVFTLDTPDTEGIEID